MFLNGSPETPHFDMNKKESRHRAILERIAYRAMIERGFEPDFSLAIIEELNHPPKLYDVEPGRLRDLRHLLWCSIDNEESRDLDQLTVAEPLSDGTARILVAIADVDTLVRKDSPFDNHARQNTTSVYTAARIFPMLPERLSTDLTSLNYCEDRLAMVIEMIVWGDGSLTNSSVYEAIVRNQAKLSYDRIAPWLEGKSPEPDSIAAVDGLAENLRLQDRVALELKEYRHERGAFDLDTFESSPVFDEDEVLSLHMKPKNRAREIIEDFMIAANSVTARFLETRKYPSLRRIVRSPRRWDRIVELVSDFGFQLPPTPDSRALGRFLARQRATDPLRFPDLALSIIKLIGPGEYVVERPGETNPGHFGLAIEDYTHATAPNRRFADLITQRILKAALSGKPSPYDTEELEPLATRCTEKEKDAQKVERLVAKSAAALLLGSRIGERFDAVVTGAAEKGTWVRVFHPPIEGKLVEGFGDVDVGQKVRVELVRTDVERGFIDFKKIKRL